MRFDVGIVVIVYKIAVIIRNAVKDAKLGDKDKLRAIKRISCFYS